MKSQACSVIGCDRPARTRGWCSAHYDRWLYSGDPGRAEIRQTPVGTCSVEGCDRPAKTRGWCRGHYQRVCRYGHPGRPDFPKPVAGSTPCSVKECDRAAVVKGLCRAHDERRRNTGSAGSGAIAKQRTVPEPCAVSGCGRKAKAKQYCQMHHERWKRNGDPGPAGLVHKPAGPCRLPDCSEPREAFEYCKKHYRRYRRYGDPETVVYSQWLGDAVGYEGVHFRLYEERGSASEYLCNHCQRPAEDWAYDHCDSTEKRDALRGMPYSVDLQRYKPLCKLCHQRFDRQASVHATVPRDQWATIRVWARDKGLPVGRTGPLSRRVIMAYMETVQPPWA